MRTIESNVESLPEPGQKLAANLRSAVRAEGYQDIPDLVTRYSERLQNRLREAPPDLAEAEQWLAEAAELLHWAKSTVAANRAHAQAKLSQIDRAGKYRPQAGANPRTWAVEA